MECRITTWCPYCVVCGGLLLAGIHLNNHTTEQPTRARGHTIKRWGVGHALAWMEMASDRHTTSKAQVTARRPVIITQHEKACVRR